MEETAARGGEEKSKNPTTSKPITTKKQPTLGTVIAGFSVFL